MRDHIMQITREDASILCGYILQETGYTENKFAAMIADYGNELKKHRPPLPRSIARKLQTKWGLRAQVADVAAALASATIGRQHVSVVKMDGRQMQIEIEPPYPVTPATLRAADPLN